MKEKRERKRKKESEISLVMREGSMKASKERDGGREGGSSKGRSYNNHNYY